jgi:hypothetical protein
MADKRVTIQNEDNVSLDFVLNEADAIWADFRRRKISLADNPALDENYNRVVAEHKKLQHAYPMVLRHMLQQGLYDSGAFKKYLIHLQTHPWTKDAERLDSYTDYYILMYKALNKRKWTQTEIQACRRNYRQMLQQEHDDFIAEYKKYEKKVEAQEKDYAVTRRINLIKAFQRMSIERGFELAEIKKLVDLAREGGITEDHLQNLCAELAKIPINESIVTTPAGGQGQASVTVRTVETTDTDITKLMENVGLDDDVFNVTISDGAPKIPNGKTEV